MGVLRSVPLLRDLDVAFTGARVLAETGIVGPVRPDRLLGMGLALARWGVSPATAYGAWAMRSPDRVAVVDHRGSHTFADIHRRSNAVANGLRALGVDKRDTVAVLARNSADFVVMQVGAAKAGADLVYLNTGFSGPQLADVASAEDVAAVLADGEFAERLQHAAAGRLLVLARHGDDPLPAAAVDLGELAAGDDGDPPPTAGRNTRHVVLTSGTTGRPKGAARQVPGAMTALEPVAALLGAIPIRAWETTVLAAPMFHAWGFAHLELSWLLESTLVLSRRFNAEHVLQQVEQHHASVLVAVPVMLQRLLEVPEERRRRHDVSSLRVVAVSGSALSPQVAQRFRDAYGDVLYDLYGSTEVAYATVATPADMREAPGAVGRPLHGVHLKILDEHDRELPPGQVGRIFVGNSMSFSGYTGGGDKDRVDGLLATGDLGRIDEHGRLWVTGRADDMIVSGGENVFPAEVEECLHHHPGVADVAVVGMPDEEFGQRLVAHVVRKNGSNVDADELRAHVKANLANYKVPREVVFHDSLPRNETGKVVKRELRGEASS